jgi:hypothetical protein
MPPRTTPFLILWSLFAFLYFFAPRADAATYGIANATNVTSANVYVDAALNADCPSSNYSKASRNCAGSDGKAYRTVQNGVSNASAGHTIAIRGGNYNIGAITLNSKTLVAYNDERVTLSGCIDLQGNAPEVSDLTLQTPVPDKIKHSKEEAGVKARRPQPFLLHPPTRPSGTWATPVSGMVPPGSAAAPPLPVHNPSGSCRGCGASADGTYGHARHSR